jgi:hypothetical protein
VCKNKGRVLQISCLVKRVDSGKMMVCKCACLLCSWVSNLVHRR